jgi:hypothetical protein
MATRNASSIVSFSTTAASGSSSLGATASSSWSGNGCSQVTSNLAVPWRGAWRGRLCSASRHAFVAIRYSQARNVERPWKLARLRQARRSVSCTMSSESSNEPSIR